MEIHKNYKVIESAPPVDVSGSEYIPLHFK